MAFTTEEFEEEGVSTKVYTPDSSSWLDNVAISKMEEDGSLCVQFWLKEPVTGEDRIRHSQKVELLNGLVSVFERGFEEKAVHRFFDEAEQGVIDVNGYLDVVDCDAGPTSKIRSILQQSTIPLDIQQAVTTDLQKIWAKTPD